MGFRYRPNPAIEDPMQAEAELLMQEEQAAMMPNTPRDPVAEIKKKKLMEEFLRKGGGPGYGIGSPIPQSQNPFAERVPDEKEQAMTAAALRHAQAPSVAEVQSFRQYPDDFAPSQKEWDNDNPMAPTIDRAGKELQVDRPSDLPGAPDNPKPPAPEDLNSKPGNSALREALMQNINGDQNPKAPPMYSPEYVDALKNNSGTNRNLGLMALLAKSSNQMGAIGGKVADSSGVEDFSNMAVAQNNAGMGQINALESQRMKQSSTADKTKLILELLKLDQGAESNNTRNRLLEDSLASRNQTSQAMTEIARGNLDVRRNPPAPVLNPLQEEKIKADIKLTEANAKKAAMPGAGKRDPVDAEVETTVAKDTAKALNALGTYKGWLAGFDSAPSESEKINYAKMNLKALQSADFGPDAINASDEPRLTGLLNQFRPMEAMREGGKVFSPQLDTFRSEIIRKMQAAEARVKKNQETLKGVRDQGAVNYQPGASNSAPAPSPGMKWQVNKRTGERRQVPISQ